MTLSFTSKETKLYSEGNNLHIKDFRNISQVIKTKHLSGVKRKKTFNYLEHLAEQNLLLPELLCLESCFIAL